MIMIFWLRMVFVYAAARHPLHILLLPRCFSHVRLCATPETAAHQALPSLGFSRQEHWSELPLPSPMHKSESEVAQSCLTLNDPVDCSPPGSSVPGIFQARVLEWGAIAFSPHPSYLSSIGYTARFTRCLLQSLFVFSAIVKLLKFNMHNILSV